MLFLTPIYFIVFVTIVNCSDFNSVVPLVKNSSSSAPLEFSDSKVAKKSFRIDFENHRFLKDGVDFRFISGAIHYFRVHPDDWTDRLRKLRMAGFNTLETYVEWSSHEPEPGVYDFTGILDLEEYLRKAMQEDLLVILRVGPYICAERDMGGLPYWLLRMNPNMNLRTADPSYLQHVDNYLGPILLPKIKPFLYANGGPVVSVQVENEYRSYAACDFEYTSHLRDLFKQVLGSDVVLFTTDGAGTGYLKCGKIPGVYATVDFGPGGNVKHLFEPQRLFEPEGPLVNSEYYPGWLDHWGEPHNTRDPEEVAKTFQEMLEFNASVNVFVFHGGTNFGFTSGANLGTNYQPCPTSYDYDAPLTEDGNPTEKYFLLRNITSNYLPLPPGEVPGPSPKYSYGSVTMTPESSVLQLATYLQSVTSRWPLTFEALQVPNGLVLYQTTVPKRYPMPSVLNLSELHDRGYVFVEDQLVGVASREQDIYEVPVSALVNQTISIVVESQGRIGYGPNINDFKGLTGNVTLNKKKLENWKMTPYPLIKIQRLQQAIARQKEAEEIEVKGTPSGGLTFYRGSFQVPEEDGHPQNTFLRLDGWTKGVAWVNDFCLGRYWPVVGPQLTLYVPHGVLKQGTNSLLLMELEASLCVAFNATCSALLTDVHDVNGPTPTLDEFENE